MIRMEIKTRVLPADEAGVAEAAQLLRQGQLVALPTETVYGIAADARNGAAVRNIFVAKGRPQDNPSLSTSLGRRCYRVLSARCRSAPSC